MLLSLARYQIASYALCQLENTTGKTTMLPVPVAARSKAWVYGRSPAAIVGSNPTRAWLFVCCECCVL